MKILLLIFCIFFTSCTYNPLTKYEYVEQHMGTSVKIVLYASKKIIADSVSQLAFTKISELDSILSNYKNNSELNMLTKNSSKNIKQKVSQELWDIMFFSDHLSKKTQGHFDLTCGLYTKLWNESKKTGVLPTAIELEQARLKTGYNYIKYYPKNKEVEFLVENMQLDPGGIAKGYAADKAMEIITKAGIENTYVDLGGDIVFSKPPNGEPFWIVGLDLNISKGKSNIIKLNLNNESVATSGNLYKNIIINGIKYSHIINPKTGLGLTTNIQVTIIAPQGTIADSYASAVSVLGFTNGKEFIKNNSEIEGIIIEEKYGTVKWWASKGFLDKSSPIIILKTQ